MRISLEHQLIIMDRFGLTAEEFLVIELIRECKRNPDKEEIVNPENPKMRKISLSVNRDPLFAYYKLPIQKQQLKDILDSLVKKKVVESYEGLKVKFTKTFMRTLINSIAHSTVAESAAKWFND